MIKVQPPNNDRDGPKFSHKINNFIFANYHYCYCTKRL